MKKNLLSIFLMINLLLGTQISSFNKSELKEFKNMDKIYKYNLFKDYNIIQGKIFYKQKRSTLNAKIDKVNLLLSFN